ELQECGKAGLAHEGGDPQDLDGPADRRRTGLTGWACEELGWELGDLLDDVSGEADGLDKGLGERKGRRRARHLGELDPEGALVLRRLRARHDDERPDGLASAVEDDRDLIAGVAPHVALQLAGPYDVLAVDALHHIAWLDSGGLCGRARRDLFHLHHPGRRLRPEGELEHAHAEQARREVVPELVHGDDRREHHEEERDGEGVLREELDETAHQATASVAASEARTDASMAMTSSSSGSRDCFAFAPSSAPRRRSGAISVNGMSPARNRSTATSSAAERPIIAPRSPDRAVSSTTAKHG